MSIAKCNTIHNTLQHGQRLRAGVEYDGNQGAYNILFIRVMAINQITSWSVHEKKKNEERSRKIVRTCCP